VGGGGKDVWLFFLACFQKLKQWAECGSSLFCLQNMVRIVLEVTCAVEYDIYMELNGSCGTD
jgi:hypothetical protein